MKIGVAIVNYHKADRLCLGLESLARQTHRDIAVSVLDNSTSDTEYETIRAAVRADPGASVRQSDHNIGYSSGMNIAASLLPGHDLLLAMSPDIILDDPGVLSKLVELMRQNPDVGILAPTQHNDDTTPVEVARSFPSLFRQVARRLSRGRLYQDTHILSTLSEGALARADWVQSSFCLVRSQLWADLGGYDERFFIFMADADFSRRAARLGWQTAIVHMAGIRADGLRASTGGLVSSLRSASMRHHIRDAIRYYVLPVKATGDARRADRTVNRGVS